MHHRMILADLKFAADPETCLLLNGPRQIVGPGIHQVRGDWEDAHLHPAGDVHAHLVGNDRVFHGQHPADGFC